MFKAPAVVYGRAHFCFSLWFVQFQMEVESHIQQNADKDICGQIYHDFEYYESGLSSAFEAFKQDTAEPVWNLRWAWGRIVIRVRILYCPMVVHSQTKIKH